MERRMFLGALGALAVVANAPEVKASIEAATKDLDPNEDLTLEEHIRKLHEWIDELKRDGTFQGRPMLSEGDMDKLRDMVRKREAAIDGFTKADVKSLMEAAESGENAGYCPKPNGTWPAVAAADIEGIKRILVEGKVAVDRHGFVVTDAIASPQDRWKLAPIRYATSGGKLRKGSDRSHDWLWGMRIAYLDVMPPGVMVMWTNLEVNYEPLKVKDPNAVVIVYI